MMPSVLFFLKLNLAIEDLSLYLEMQGKGRAKIKEQKEEINKTEIRKKLIKLSCFFQKIKLANLQLDEEK